MNESPAAKTSAPTDDSNGVSTNPIGIVAPEWSLKESARGAALWRHAGVMKASGIDVELLALDPASLGRRFLSRDEWNAPAKGVRFRVHRVNTGPRGAAFDELDKARLLGKVLDWARERRPRLVHVLDMGAFGPELLVALEAARVRTLLTIEHPELLVPYGFDDDAFELQREALASCERIVVRSVDGATLVENAGAPRSSIRVVPIDRRDDRSILRAYASLYRALAPESFVNASAA